MKEIYNRDSVNSDLILNSKKSSRWLGWISLCLMFLFGTTSFAQVSTYVFAQSNGTYTEITDGTVLGTATAVNSYDATLFSVPDGTIPFAFAFNGSSYTGCSVNSNGYITFGTTTSTASSSSPISSTIAYKGAISPWGGDLNASYIDGIIQSQVSYKVVGTSPNREFVIQFKDWRPSYSTSATVVAFINFQIRLHENKEVKIVYGSSGFKLGTSTTISGTRQVGLRGATNADYLNRANTTSGSFVSSANGTSNFASQAFKLGATPGMPTEGLTYSYVPPVFAIDMAATSIVGIPASACSASDVALSVKITNNGSNAIDFSTNNAAISVAITGASTQTLNATVTSGILAIGASQDVIVSPNANFSASGTHNIAATVTVTGDGLAGNNTFSTSKVIGAIVTAPYAESFTTTTTPTGWNTTGWTIATSHGVTTSGIYKNMYSSAATGQFNTITVGPISATSELKFDYRIVDYTSYPATATIAGWGNFKVQISTDCGGTFTDLQTVNDANHTVSTNWATKTISLSPTYSGQNVQIRILATWAAGDYYLDFDNFSIAPLPTCASPSTLTATSVGATTATLNWTPASPIPASGYDIYYSTVATAPTGSTTPTVNNHTASPVSLTGLSSANTYYWWVRGDCNPDTSIWVSGGSFTTLCEALIAPTAVQNFETFNGTAPSPICWTEATGTLALNTTLSGTASGWTLNTNGFANASAANKGFSINLYGTKNEWMISPSIDLGATAGIYRLKYRYAATSYNGTTIVSTLGTHKVDVVISTDGGTTWSNANSVKTYTGAASYSNSGAFETINLTAYSGVVKIAFVASTTLTTPDLDFHIDDFSVESIPSCLEPTALTSSNIATTTATLSWTASTSSPANGYDVYYSTTNTAPLAGATPTVNNHTASPLNATGLTSSSTYYWWVRSDCGAENSTWTSGGSFTTLCNATNVPYAENFESAIVPALPNCTASQNVGTGNNWVTINNPGSGFTSNTLKYGYNSSDANAWFYTAGINLVAGKSYLVSYDYGNKSTFAEKMKVAVGTSAVNTAMTTELANYPNIVGAALQSANVTFTPSVSGVYYFGFNAYSIAGQWDLYLDNIKVEAACPTGVWVGTTSNWNTASNWADNMVPEACTNVTVNVAAPMTISSNVSVASITLGASAIVTVGSTGVLNVGTISVATGGNLTINSDGVVLQSSTAANTAVATVKRNSSPLYRLDYSLWSSPVAGQNLRAFSTQTLFNRFSSYVTSTNSYLSEIETIADMNTKTFTNAKGYLIRMPNNWIEYTGTAASYQGSFTGTLNNGTVSIPLSGEGTGMNLVGNPYPSPISIASFLAANNNITSTMYFWRKKSSGAPGNAVSGYATLNAMGFTSADGDINGVSPTKIQTGQGFFVVASSASPANLVFNNTMRTSGSATFYKNSNETNTELHRIWLNLTSGTNVVGQTLIGYATGATQGVDNDFDAPYFNDSPLALTSIINNAEFIIQGRALAFTDTDVVPLGFKTDVAGSYTIALSNFDGVFSGNQDIFLRDITTNTMHNLKTAAYTFTSAVGVFNTRFELRYQGTLDTNNPSLGSSSILIAVKDQQIKINAGSVTMEKVELIDVAGRVIYTLEGINATTATIENLVSSNQMLIVRISTKGNGVVSQKIIF